MSHRENLCNVENGGRYKHGFPLRKPADQHNTKFHPDPGRVFLDMGRTLWVEESLTKHSVLWGILDPCCLWESLLRPQLFHSHCTGWQWADAHCMELPSPAECPLPPPGAPSGHPAQGNPPPAMANAPRHHPGKNRGPPESTSRLKIQTSLCQHLGTVWHTTPILG